MPAPNLLGKAVQGAGRRLAKYRRLSIVVAAYRRARFYPGRFKLAAWRVDYGSGFYPVFVDQLDIPLAELNFDERALTEMRLVMDSNAPSSELSALLCDRFGADFDTGKTPLYFERWKALARARGPFTICAQIGPFGELSVIDGAHRLATALLAGEDSIGVVLGVRNPSLLARTVYKLRGAIN